MELGLTSPFITEAVDIVDEQVLVLEDAVDPLEIEVFRDGLLGCKEGLE